MNQFWSSVLLVGGYSLLERMGTQITRYPQTSRHVARAFRNSKRLAVFFTATIEHRIIIIFNHYLPYLPYQILEKLQRAREAAKLATKEDILARFWARH